MENSKGQPLVAAPTVSDRLTANKTCNLTIIIALLLLAITSLPYLYGYLSTPPDKWFSGVIFNVHDTAQYLSWIRESATSVFIENKLTSEPNASIFLNLHWWIPGRIAALLGLSPIQIYQVFRLLAVPLQVMVGIWFCSLFFRNRSHNLFAFLLGTLTSGLGWLWVVDKYMNRLSDVRFPHDLYTTPGNTFWVMLASPHLTFALSLTLLALGLAWLGYQQQQFGFSLAAGGVALFLGMGHVYDLVTVWTVLLIFGVFLTLRDGFRWQTFFSLFVVVLVSAPAPLYFGWVSSPANPLWQQALAQYDNLGAFTPSPLHLLVLLGITFFLALGGFFQRLGSFRKLSNRDLFIKGWFIANLIIIYLPLRFQVMLLTGFQFVLAILATDFVFTRFIPWLQVRLAPEQSVDGLTKKRLAQWVPVLLLLAVLPTNLYLFAWRLVDLQRNSYPIYLYQDEVAGMHWLESNVNPDEVVLSAFVTGHYIPGLAGNKAFLANAVMTMDYAHKRKMVNDFFNPVINDSERLAIIQKYDIRYIFYGPAERELGVYSPTTSPWLTLAYSTPQVDIYQVEESIFATVEQE